MKRTASRTETKPLTSVMTFTAARHQGATSLWMSFNVLSFLDRFLHDSVLRSHPASVAFLKKSLKNMIEVKTEDFLLNSLKTFHCRPAFGL